MMSLPTLQNPRQFRQVYTGGKKIDCKYAFLFYYRTGDSTDGPRFGFVASKRLGVAVKRNRAKRLLREAVARSAHRLKYRDLWLVLVARTGIINIKSQELLATVEQKLEEEGLIDLEASP